MNLADPVVTLMTVGIMRRSSGRVFHIYAQHLSSADDDHSTVTGTQFEVKESGMKIVLFLRLHFSRVTGATFVKNTEWDGSPAFDSQVLN